MEVAGFSVTNTISSASLIISFILLTAFGDRRTWLTTDCIATFCVGVGFTLTPTPLLEIQTTGKLNDEHLLLGRLLGASLIGSVIVTWLSKNTRDGTVPITLTMSRVFSCSILLGVQIYSVWGTDKGKKNVDFNNQFVQFAIVGTSLWVLGNLIHLSRSFDFNTYPQFNIRLNTHLRIDAWLSLLVALIFLAMPDLVLNFLCPSINFQNILHLYLCRSIGAVLLSSAVTSLQAPGYLHERDKISQMFSSSVATLLLAAVFTVSSLLTQTHTLRQLADISSVAIPQLLNCFFAIFTDSTVIYRVPKSSPSKKSKTILETNNVEPGAEAILKSTRSSRRK